MMMTTTETILKEVDVSVLNLGATARCAATLRGLREAVVIASGASEARFGSEEFNDCRECRGFVIGARNQKCEYAAQQIECDRNRIAVVAGTGYNYFLMHGRHWLCECQQTVRVGYATA